MDSAVMGAPCPDCGGSGRVYPDTEPGTEAVLCQKCHGSGAVPA